MKTVIDDITGYIFKLEYEGVNPVWINISLYDKSKPYLSFEYIQMLAKSFFRLPGLTIGWSSQVALDKHLIR